MTRTPGSDGLPLRGVLLAAALLLAVAAPVVAQTAPASPSAPEPSPSAGGVQASGTVVARTTYGLGFGRAPAIVPRGAAVSGANTRDPWLVVSVDVQPGEVVSAGQVLAAADATVLELQVASAQEAVKLAEARLTRTLGRPTEAERTKADALLAQARQKLEAAEDALAATQAQGAAAIQGASEAEELAQRLLRADQEANQPSTVIAGGRRAWAGARAALGNAQAAAVANEARAQAAVDGAALALEAAEVDHATAIAGATPDQVAADQAALATARLNLARAEESLRGASIVAPADGTVSRVDLAVGATAPAGDAIQLQEGPLEALVQVPEGELLRVALGDLVRVRVPALGAVLDGSVSSIGLLPGSGPNAPAVTYPVSIQLADVPATMRPGMTVTVEIVRAG